MKNLALILALVAAPLSARAALLEVFATARVGAATGKGLGGAQKDNDFFAGAKGATYGAIVGLEVVWMDFFVEHDQFTDFKSVNGTWTQLMIGPHFPFPLNEGLPGTPAKLYADLGAFVGFGFGTGQQIDPPLDDAQISDKGLVAELRVGLDYRANRFMSIGLSFPLGWAYLLKNDLPATETNGHYQSFHAMALGTFTVRLGL